MLINLRNAMMGGKRLPYDAEVEYLESTGTQWIDTGYVYNADSKFVCDAMLMSVPSYLQATMFGALQNYNGVFLALNNTVPIQARFGAKTVGNIVSDLSVQNAVGVRHKYELSARRLSIDDDVFTRSGFTPYTVNRSIWLCSCNDSESGNLNKRPCSLRVYTFAIYNGNALVRDFIPVRVGTTGFLYDRVSGKLFGNEGTGDFVLGPDVVPVEYIESHGTEYIDTGLAQSTNTSINIDCLPRNGLSYNGTPYSGPLFGNVASADTFCYTAGANNDFFVCVSTVTLPSNKTDRQTITMSNSLGTRTADGSTQTYQLSGATLSGQSSIYLFARRTASTPGCGTWRIYSALASENGDPVRKFRAVRVGTEGAMMDTLTRRIYRNAGTGAFGYGNDLKYPIPA